MNIKTTIGIIAVVLSSATIAEASENRHGVVNGHHYNQEQQQHYRQTHQRAHWQKARQARHYYKEQRHYRRHHYNKHNRYQRSHGYYSNSQYMHHTRYITPQSYSHTVVISGRANHALPILAGGLIGSVIANNASGGDSAATFGGAVFGALIGNALSHH